MNALDIWTVYWNPSDCRGMYVARRHVADASGSRPTLDRFVHATLDGVRALLPPGLTRMERHQDDDPVIVETWI